MSFSPHGVRRAFASYGERDLGFGRSEPALILDHLEGSEPNDVTAAYYSLDPQLRRKREMVAAWIGWLHDWAKRAIDVDPELLDVTALRSRIYRARYGDVAWNARVARETLAGRPAWPANDDLQEAAE